MAKDIRERLLDAMVYLIVRSNEAEGFIQETMRP